jgi:hypothetical protein
MEVSVQLHALAAIPPGKDPSFPHYLLDRRMGRPQRQSEHSGEEQKSAAARNQTPVFQPVA